MKKKSPEKKDKPENIRINRFLAMSGVASRRASEELITNGEVKVNGKVVTNLATQITPTKDSVTVRGKNISIAQQLLYLVLHKPKDYITTAKDEKGRRTVFDLLSINERVFPIGRLDRNTSGVLLFTNDGMLATKLMHPSSHVTKSYHVALNESAQNPHLEKIAKGMYLEDGKTAPAEIEIIPGTKQKEIVLTIHEGKNRQIRRMFETLGYEIEKLHRISYANITAKGLGRGRWRFLTEREVKELKSLVE